MENVKRRRLYIGAVLATGLWGSAFPCVKLGYAWLHIQSGDVGSQMYFAGIRFLLAGLSVLLVGSLWQHRFLVPERKEGEPSPWRLLLALALCQTFWQYVFYYIGLAHVPGSRASILNALGTLFTVLFGMIYFRNRPTVKKVLGIIIGMSGVLAACFSGIEGGMHPAGEGALFLSALFAAAGNIINKKASGRQEPLLVTGWHLSVGGVLLLALGLCMGGTLTIPDIKTLALIVYMIFISAAGFGIWSWLLRQFPVEEVAVFHFLVPVFGTFLSGLVLGEGIRLATIAALGLVCVGIVLVQVRDRDKMNRKKEG